MAGNTNQPRQEVPQIFSITVPGPIDDRTVISRVSNLGNELNPGIRYTGQLVWVENSDINGDGTLNNQGEFYTFATGTEDSDFIQLKSLIRDQSTGNGLNLSIVFTYNRVQPANRNFILAHNLNSRNLQVSTFDSNTPILLNYEIIDNNSIQISPNADLNELRVVITFADTLFTNPPAFVTAEDLPLHKISISNISSEHTQIIAGNTEIVKVIYRMVTGTPSVTAGFTTNATDFHTTKTPSTTEDSVTRIDRTFIGDTNFVINVSGGTVNTNIYLRENSFI